MQSIFECLKAISEGARAQKKIEISRVTSEQGPYGFVILTKGMIITKITIYLFISEVHRSWKKQPNCTSDLQIHSKWQRNGEVRSGTASSIRVVNIKNDVSFDKSDIRK